MLNARRHRRLRAALSGAAALFAATAHGQDGAASLLGEIDREQPVALVADEVTYDEVTGLLTARGAVEVYYGERTLTASEIVYDSRADRIRASGPLALRDGQGTTLLADAADIDPALRDGVVEGARALIADGAGAMAAAEARRVDGRYTLLSRAVYSSCEVCAARPTPLWSIRAARVLHDEEARQVHYEDAVFDVMGVPVAWLPYFRHPDPGVDRASGFLPATFSNSSRYGFAAQVPYYVVIDESSDATITPFVTTRDGGILIGEYRRRFDYGRLDLGGSFGLLDIREGDGREARGAINSSGRYDLAAFGFAPRTIAGFDVNLASDDGYLRRYDFTDDDRLTSTLFVERWGDRDFFSLAGVYFQSLRDGERQGEIANALPEFTARQTLGEAVFGGELALTTSGVYLSRDDGRDVGRISLGADWSREVILDMGLALRGFGEARGDVYRIDDDPAYGDEVVTRLAPLAGVEARYPLISRQGDVAHLLEPGVQFVVSPNGANDDRIPNEDSLLVEFDETSVFDVDRFPGYDRFESGTRLNLGLRYQRVANDPWRADAAIGQVLRLSDQGAFSEGSGLVDRASDYVAAWTLGYDPYVLVTNRIRISDGLDLARNEVAARGRYGPATVTASYLYLEQDATAGALDDRQELALGGTLAVDPQWTVGAFMRRDLTNDRSVETAGTLTFSNECASLELYVQRDFTDSRNAPASTDVGVRVRLFGSADGAGARSGVCGPR